MKRFIGSILVAVFVATTFVGCKAVDGSPKNVVETYFKDIKEGNNEKATDLVMEKLNEDAKENKIELPFKEKEPSEDVNKALKKLLSNIDYKIINENSEGDNTTFEVSLNNANFSNLFLEYMYDYMSSVLSKGLGEGKMSDEEKDRLANSKLAEFLSSADVETRTAIVTLKKYNDKWEVESNEELKKLLLGELSIK